ncbi:MAG: Outer membrane protein assembly factor BamB [Candidatus Methanogaster sp.]|nr:MAG: Outer membrane protein assembly factor BamB [ANME-2 cluster archaeon]
MNRIYMKTGLTVVLAMVPLISPVFAQAGTQNEVYASDWPTWRYDVHRSASSPEGLPAELNLQWVHQYTARGRVWNDPLNWDVMRYDKNFEPIVVGNTMFLAFSDSDKIVALDTETGEEKWRFYTGGPVRLPPAVWNETLYATSDDGYLYCLNAATGDLNWKFQAAPGDRKVLGNNRLISTWPARGGVVIEDGRVYFAASIFPMMGTFIYCLDSETGDVIWLNDGEGARWTDLPHGTADGFGGIAPQGALTISGDKLLVPGGRSVPACLDKNTGEFEYYRLGDNGKNGGDFVAANDRVFFNHYVEKNCNMFNTSNGDKIVSKIGRFPVIDGDTIYTSYEGTVAAYNITEGAEWGTNQLWTISADATGDLIKAGNYLYASGDGSITAIEIGNGNQTIAWIIPVNDVVERLVAANGKLFAVTLDGRIMAFGRKEVEPNRILDIPAPAAVSHASTEEARSILEKTGVSEGYALFYGIGDGDLLEALACNSELDIIAVDEDETIVEEMRQRFDETGLYGKRISVLQGDTLTLKAQQYMASLTIVNLPATIVNVSVTYEDLCDYVRPYGGKLVFRMSTGGAGNLSSAIERSQNMGSFTSESVDIEALTTSDKSKHGNSGIRSSGTMTILTREGPLNGSAPFTHNVGDIANTGKTNDDLVKPPLGVLWFGGELSNVDVLPRHGHGPPPQVIGGRLFIEGMDKLTCVDVYTGRQIWQRQFDDMETYGIYYDESHKDTPTGKRYNQEHLAGANIRGTNYVATEDKIYIINAKDLRHEHWAQVLDAATGELLMNIELPKFEDERQSWGYIGVYEDLLIGGGELVPFSDVVGANKSEYDLRKDYNMRWEDYDYSASARLYVMDRHSGAVKWSFESEFGFLHNGIVAGKVGGSEMLFVLDKLHPGVEAQLERRGEEIPTGYRLVALDINTGNVLWETTDGIFGSYLSLSEEYGMLLESTRASRDTVRGESGTRMVAYNARDGGMLWNESAEYKAFPILYHDTIICGAESWGTEKQAKHFSLLTGVRLTRESPITGSDVELSWARGYGCNHPLASEHMVFFRSGAAGYFDLNQNSGTGNFGGFKSGCTESLVAADGVLNSPDYTRTCICAYQNQLSLAMVHMPENEAWTFNELDMDNASIASIGLNLGAPGDRVSENGTWWFEYPIVGGPSPDIHAEITGEAEYFTHHSSRFEGEIPWVAASGCQGISSLALNNATGNYTVRLYFAEPDDATAGERVFDVAIQGEVVLSDFDVVSEAGETRKTVVKSFDGVIAGAAGRLVVTFTATGDAGPIINGIEVVQEPPTPQDGVAVSCYVS